MSKTLKVPLPTRVKPSAKRELERLARRQERPIGTYAALVLEAHAQGLTMCPVCGFPHPIHPMPEK